MPGRIEIVSVNIAHSRKIIHNGKEEVTGYFKESVQGGIFLGKDGVKGDVVADLKNHGGPDKAVYVYGLNHYASWKKIFPAIKWHPVMFGENLTVDELDESTLNIGDEFAVGNAIVQVSQPRQPCYKMGIRFNDQKMVDLFRRAPRPGVYLRVLQEGNVKAGDIMSRISSPGEKISVTEIFRLIYDPAPGRQMLEAAIENEFLAQRVKARLTERLRTL